MTNKTAQVTKNKLINDIAPIKCSSYVKQPFVECRFGCYFLGGVGIDHRGRC